MLRAGDRIALTVEPRTLLVCLLLAAAVAAVAAVSIGLGTSRSGIAASWAALLQPDGSALANLVWRIRLPRAVAALLAGLALGAAGSVFQTVSRNALGSPEIVGVTAGAACGAVVAIVAFGARGAGVSLAAIAGCAAASVLTTLLARRGRTTLGDRLVLVGIGVGAFLQAVTTWVLAHSDPNIAIAGQIWLTGTLNARTWQDAGQLAVAVAILLPTLVALSRGLGMLVMADDAARQFGVRTELVRLGSVAVGVGLVGAAVAACGPISFVALAAPHLVRALTRSPGVPLVAAGLMGALLLSGADLLVQVLPTATRPPVGIATGVLGGIYLMVLLQKGRHA